jgi:colicin import membrane protein
MTLYSANVLSLAKPVTKGKKKVVEAVVEEEPVGSDEAKAKPKRVMSEAQKAALAKGQETRKRKREEAEMAKRDADAEIEAKKKELEDKAKELAAKKEAVKEKRRLARQAKTMQTPTPQSSEAESSVDAAVDTAVEQEVDLALGKKKTGKRAGKKVVKSDDEPPAWFHKYVQSVKQEEGKLSSEKKPVKVINEEAKVHAGAAWNDGLTRNRVQSEVDSHMNRMYSQIFGMRKMRV